MRAALKAREKIKLGALRLLSASVKNREVELRHPLNDEEFVEVAMREVKRRKEAIEAFSGAGRDDRRRPRRVRETWGRSWAMSWARPEEGWTERKCRPECESA